MTFRPESSRPESSRPFRILVLRRLRFHTFHAFHVFRSPKHPRQDRRMAVSAEAGPDCAGTAVAAVPKGYSRSLRQTPSEPCS